MARLFVLMSLLEEAYRLDISENQRRARRIHAHKHNNCVANYRLSEDLINIVLNDIKAQIKFPQRRRRGLSAKIKFLGALSFFASGSYQRVCGKSLHLHMSQSSLSRCVHEIVAALSHPENVKKYIRFPQNLAERQCLKEKFYQRYKIPDVLGCIDCTFATMMRPTENEDRYFCGKGYARNVQLITDAELNILHVDVTYGGATHDSFIFDNSVIKEHLAQLIDAGENVHLLGDSGYAQRAYLMTPVHNAEEGPASHYNKVHASAHNSIERTIGILKGRFRCLLVHRKLHYDPDTVGKIIIACCVLHNICNRGGMAAPALARSEQQEEAQFRRIARAHASDTAQTDDALGLDARNQLLTSLWRSRNV